MIMIILIAFFVSIIVVIIRDLMRYGKDKDTFTIILEDVFRIRGFYFLLFWIWVVISMMKAVEGDERWALLPFLLCGLSAILLMYEKTKEIGKKAFFISFFGGFGILIILGILHNYGIL